MKVDRLMSGYRSGILTRGELFGWFTELLVEDPRKRAIMLAALDSEPAVRARFETWLRGLTIETEILHHGEILRPTTALVAELSGPVSAPPHDGNIDPSRLAIVKLTVDEPAENLPRRFFAEASRRRPGEADRRWSAVVEAIFADAPRRAIVAASLSLLSADAPPFELGESVEIYVGSNRVATALVSGAQHGAGGLPTDDDFLVSEAA